MELRAGGRAFRLASLAVVAALTPLLISCARAVDSPGVPPTPSPRPIISDDESEDALGVAEAFLAAAAEKNYARVWALLSPEARSQWAAEEAFAAFLDRKFGAVKLDFDLGRLEPEVDGSLARFPISLRIAGDDARIAGPSLVLIREDESWAVSDPGPFGRYGPVVGSPAPIRPEINVPILIYHHVAPDLPAEGEDFNTVTTEAFARQLQWLADTGHVSISVAELFNAFHYDLPLPSKPVILVFDDGYADIYELAFPLLRDRGFGATVAAITGAMDHSGYLTWDQAREMSAAGIEFVSHTVSHGNLATASRDEARSELADSRRSLEENLGRPIQFFVYPYGEPFTSGSPEAREMVLALLRESGYAGALTTSSGPPYISLQRADAPYLLHRIPVSGGESIERFAASVEPAPTPTPSSSPTPDP
jgi:peptidoglycan/xylan/chitin deacetylase (PgdA/CDA1 family)